MISESEILDGFKEVQRRATQPLPEIASVRHENGLVYLLDSGHYVITVMPESVYENLSRGFPNDF